MPAFTSPAALRRLSRAGSLRTNAPAPTQPTPTSPRADDQPAPTSPASPPARALSPPPLAENDGLLGKAVRAYERDRQRARKTKDRAERERQRAASTTGTGLADPACRHCRDGSGRRPTPKEKEWAALAPTPGTPGSPLVEEIIADVVERETRARGALEVHLAQLVKPAKARRSKAGEFELVPSIPVVIALDDCVAEDAELDEPWEHISADELDEKRAPAPSYATVVASTA